jgi:crotonobetainyl-CoA:carnitine CoA-transferase CaiB-like acyl-CoA transferase
LALSKGIPAGPIYDLKQIIEDEHISKAREMFLDVDHPVIGKMKVNGNPIKLMDTMPDVQMPAPTLGQDNDYVYGEILKMSKQEIKDLSKNGVI